MSAEIPLPITSPTAQAHHHSHPPFSFADRQNTRMTITDLTVKIPSSSRSTSIPSESSRKPSRWGTVEFKFYYVILCLALPLMIWIPITLSDRMCYLASSKLRCTEITALVCPLLASHPNYPQYQYKLWQGWLFGRNLVSISIGSLPQ